MFKPLRRPFLVSASELRSFRGVTATQGGKALLYYQRKKLPTYLPTLNAEHDSLKPKLFSNSSPQTITSHFQTYLSENPDFLRSAFFSRAIGSFPTSFKLLKHWSSRIRELHVFQAARSMTLFLNRKSDADYILPRAYKTRGLDPFKIRNLVFPCTVDYKASKLQYFLASPLNNLHLQYLSKAFKTDFFTPDESFTVLSIKPHASYRRAIEQLICKAKSLEGQFLDFLYIINRLVVFGVWKLTVHANQIKVWFPSHFNSYGIRQFLQDVGLHRVAASLALGQQEASYFGYQNLNGSRMVGLELANVSGSAFNSTAYRQELVAFSNAVERARASFGC